ncbi:hypothetical protein ISN45_Aa04g031110 [Arabidopsis thaliana x Arabidopsis arenosa]|uniref:Uncharacterized protein n=1 Tax=Arabidopsis thaliana x Arabidopsis arenosa TaxID=1240361 RepID=A0A8T2AAI2_9BRAS|nr:hypothetical protein ISN45_Aa04g031110 [Arabidopsis thaliana x Arabidopsis arenosa]
MLLRICSTTATQTEEIVQVLISRVQLQHGEENKLDECLTATERNPRSTAAVASPPPEAPASGVRGLIPSSLAFIYSLCRRVTRSLSPAVLWRDSTVVTRWCGEGRYGKRSRLSFRLGSGDGSKLHGVGFGELDRAIPLPLFFPPEILAVRSNVGESSLRVYW